MSDAGKNFEPPESVGEPFRADPGDPAPFLTDSERVPVVPVVPVLPAAPANLPRHGDDAPRTEYGAPPMIQPSGGSATDAPKAPMTANQRYARIALWLGVISIFVFQVVLGPIAVAMGVISYRRGEKKEGRLAIIFGCIGILLGIAALILVETGVIPSTEESWERIRELLRGEGQ